jgi:hypothetical protein
MNKHGGDKHTGKLNKIIDDVYAYIAVYNIHRMNCTHKLNRNNMSQLSNDSKCTNQLVAGHHGTTNDCERVQQGDTRLRF